MSTVSASQAPAAAGARRAAPAPLLRAVRTVDRWGLLAGVTSALANVLLVVLFTTPAGGPYAWTGPANDAVERGINAGHDPGRGRAARRLR